VGRAAGDGHGGGEHDSDDGPDWSHGDSPQQARPSLGLGP
jgi:hypothetical protein